MTHPIPTVIYKIGDLKNAFTLVHARRAADFGADISTSEMTMGNALVGGIKASLDALDAFNDADYIALPDKPSELATALDPCVTKSLKDYVAAGEYRVISADLAKAFIPQ